MEGAASTLEVELYRAHQARMQRYFPPAPKPKIWPRRAAAAVAAVPDAPILVWPVIPEDVPSIDADRSNSIRAIQDATAIYYRMSLVNIIRRTRTPEASRARQVAMWLAFELTHLPSTVIARAFCRDHTTILHNQKLVARMVRQDREMAYDVAEIAGRIAGSAEVLA
jgi:hypothetical protein